MTSDLLTSLVVHTVRSLAFARVSQSVLVVNPFTGPRGPNPTGVVTLGVAFRRQRFFQVFSSSATRSTHSRVHKSSHRVLDGRNIRRHLRTTRFRGAPVIGEGGFFFKLQS